MEKETYAISAFLQNHYSDAALMRLLNKAEKGELHAMHCDKCLLGLSDYGYNAYKKLGIFQFDQPERQFIALAGVFWPYGKKACARLNKAMIPIINEEISRRARRATFFESRKEVTAHASSSK